MNKYFKLSFLFVFGLTTFYLFSPKSSNSQDLDFIKENLNKTTYKIEKSKEENQNINIYSKYSEAVVFINTISYSYDPFDIFSQYKKNEGSGSGVIIDAEQGIIITNLHVISQANEIKILLSDSQSHKAKLLGYDTESDLAVLQLENIPKNLTEVKFGDSSKLQVGQRVLAIGNPFGLSKTLTTGIISSLDRTVKTDDDIYLTELIQTDAAINPGNSGGPLLDTNGRLIGLNTMILSKSGDSAGIGFSVPINQILTILPDLIKNGKVLKPYFGWVLANTNQGVVIRRIEKGSAAAKANLVGVEKIVNQGFFTQYYLDYENADFIYKIDNLVVNDKLELSTYIKNSKKLDFKLEVRKGSSSKKSRIVGIKVELK